MLFIILFNLLFLIYLIKVFSRNELSKYDSTDIQCFFNTDIKGNIDDQYSYKGKILLNELSKSHIHHFEKENIHWI